MTDIHNQQHDRRRFITTVAASVTACSLPRVATAADDQSGIERSQICAFTKPFNSLSFDELADSMAEIGFDESLVERIEIDSLPDTWNQSPPPCELRAIGDAWIVERRSAILQIPSAVVRSEYNYLVNPFHPDFAQVEIHDAQPCAIDPRLIH